MKKRDLILIKFELSQGKIVRKFFKKQTTFSILHTMPLVHFKFKFILKLFIEKQFFEIKFFKEQDPYNFFHILGPV